MRDDQCRAVGLDEHLFERRKIDSPRAGHGYAAAIDGGRVVAEGAPAAALSPEILAKVFGLDGALVETVYIPEDDRGAVCISSQVGCTLTCKFCHTGTQLLVRNLTPGEIVGQVMVARDRLGDWIEAGGDGGELQAPLARVVIGGLLASTIVTLVPVPAIYTVFEEGWGLSGTRCSTTCTGCQEPTAGS